MQGQLNALNENIERLIEQVRIANQHRFGRKTETMQSIHFSMRQRDSDLKGFPDETVPTHAVSKETLDCSMAPDAGNACRTKRTRGSAMNRNPGLLKCIRLRYMWVHRSGEFYKDRPIVIYEYQKGWNHELPLASYRDYKGVLVTDSLQQYHLVEKKLAGLINADCWAHARPDYADAIKAADNSNPNVVRRSAAYQALSRSSQIYKLERALKDLSPGQKLHERQENITPLVEEYFAWVKKQWENTVVPPKSKTADGLRYSVNQEKCLRAFLTNGNVPIDNSASERAIRTFCIGKKNWMFHDLVMGAPASAVIYSLSETVKLNTLRPYYFKHLLQYIA